MYCKFFKLISVFIFVSFLCNAETKNSNAFYSDLLYSFTDTSITDEDFYLYPTPGELLEVINKEKLSFNKDLLNPIDNEPSYILSKAKYLNLGVYMADLAYCAFFSKRAKCLDYIKIVTKLSNDLLISTELKEKMNHDFMNNIENLDTIYRLTNIYYYELMRELEKNNSENVVSVVTTGAYVECFFIALNLVGEYDSDDALIQKVAEQKFAINNLNNFSNLHQDDKNVKDILSYLEEIVSIFNSFSIEKGTERKFTITESGKIVFEGGPQIKMNESQFYQLKKSLLKIRTDIVK